MLAHPTKKLQPSVLLACRAVVSVRSVGDSYGNAMAETINWFYKAEVIHQKGQRRNIQTPKLTTVRMS